MGKRGPSPLPSNVKRLRGTDQPCRMNGDEPEYPTDAINPPEYLSQAARLHFLETRALLADANVLTNADVDALALYAQAFATWRKAIEKINELGEVVEVLVNERVVLGEVNPWVKIGRDAFAQVRQYQQELGITPSARTRVKVTAKPEKANDFGALTRGKRA
jgi:P27 family predicted phage terminase small subunit